MTTALKCHCGSECVRLDTNPNEPCWGKVHAVDEMDLGDDYAWIHACDGHVDQVMGDGPYIKETAST